MSRGPQPLIEKPLRVVLDRDHRCPHCLAWLFWCEHYDTIDADNRSEIATGPPKPMPWPASCFVYGVLELALDYRARNLTDG